MNELIKTELWNNHEIRFVEKESGQWWAVLKDVADALDLSAKWVNQRLEDEVVSNHLIVDKIGRSQEMLIVNSYGIYDVIFSSRKPEAKEFKKWVFDVIEHLRQTSGLEGFQIFRMLDKEHQKETMLKLRDSLKHPVRVDFIKANTIANKTVSTMFGYPKMVKKDSMNPNMLMQRQSVLDDTVNLMSVVDEFGIDCSVSNKIYGKYNQLS